MKKVPLRQCVGCREMKPKGELVRVVRSPEGDISIDDVGRKPGRGAYVCNSADCLRKAQKSRALERSFSQKISEEVYDALAAAIEGGGDGR